MLLLVGWAESNPPQSPMSPVNWCGPHLPRRNTGLRDENDDAHGTTIVRAKVPRRLSRRFVRTRSRTTREGLNKSR